MFCSTCGNTLHPAAPNCGRCGAELTGTNAGSCPDGQPPPSDAAAAAPVAAADAPADIEMTVDRSRLARTDGAPEPGSVGDVPEAGPTSDVPEAGPTSDVPEPAPVVLAAPPPPVLTAPPVTLLPGPAAGRPPAPVTLVSVAMLALAALLAYPVLRYACPLIPSLFAHTSFERALAALVLFLFVIVAACAAALVALAVGMLRGSRVAQVLTMLLAAAIALGVLVNGQTAAGGTQSRNAITALIVLVCLGLLALLGLPASSRSFFARDESPVGVWATATACVYFGWCISVAGLMLMIAGTLQLKFVWWGVVFVLLGAGLTTLSRPLRIGHDWARTVATLGLLSYVVAGWIFAGSNGDSGATGTVIQTGIGLGAVGLLWLLPSSGRHFAAGPHPVRARLVVQPIGWLVLGVLTVVLAGIGLSANASHSAAASINNYAAPPSESQPFLTTSAAPTPAPSVAAGALVHTWTVQESAPGGYTEAVTLSTGAPEHLQPGLTQGQLVAGSDCSIDASTDAVIPAELSETNTTNGFAAYTGASFSFGSQWNSPAVEVRFTEGPQCETNSYGDHSSNQLQPGMRSVTDMFFVVRGYYTPDHPDGDPAVLATATVAFGPASVTLDDGSTPIEYTPAAPTGSLTEADGSIPLGGTPSG